MHYQFGYYDGYYDGYYNGYYDGYHNQPWLPRLRNRLLCFFQFQLAGVQARVCFPTRFFQARLQPFSISDAGAFRQYQPNLEKIAGLPCCTKVSQKLVPSLKRKVFFYTNSIFGPHHLVVREKLY